MPTQETTEPEVGRGGVRRRADLAFGALTALLLGVLFHFYGNTSELAVDGPSLFVWLGRQLLARGSDFSHGWVIPVISLAIVFQRRRELLEAPKSERYTGLAVVIASLLLHLLAMRAQQPRVSLVALVGLLWGIPYFLYGPAVARILAFPCAYLFLCFTAYVLVYFSFRLRLLSSVVASGLLNGVGIATERVGTALTSSVNCKFQMEVGDPCSGLRSLFVMTALAAPYAYFTQKTLFRKWLLFALSVPLAIVSNTLRIVTIGIVAQLVDPEIALKVYHDFSGYLVFFISILLLTSAGTLLDRPEVREGAA
jgi:exosortase